VRVGLEPTYSKDALADDIAGTNKYWSLVISLYEEDGTWLRTLARAPFADFCTSGVLVFSGLGIALLAPDATLHQGARVIEVATPHPLPHTVSSLNAFRLRAPMPHR
jgi:hypothetical protein